MFNSGSSSRTYNERSRCTDDSYNTTASDHTFDSGIGSTGSQNEFNHYSNIYYGNVSSQPRGLSPQALETLVEAEIDWDILSRLLSVADQDKHRSTISLLDRNEPKYFWITKNIDFTEWESDEDSKVLWLSGPHDRGMKEVSSHIIKAAKEKAIQPNSCVLYFFCSTATMARGSIATVFAHTLLHQIVYSSSAGKAKSIAATFLKSLLGEHITRRRLSHFNKNDSLSMTVQNILDVPDNELYRALVEATRITEIQELSIIIDGIDINVPEGAVFVQNFYSLLQHMLYSVPKSKVLLTGIQNMDLQKPLSSLPWVCIEYDKERKECLRSLQHDDARYAKIVNEHHGSLEWLWTHEQYNQWSASTTSSLLYIEGKPGSGKSTLAKYIEKNLAEREPIARSSTIAHYFYTCRGTEIEATHCNMLRNILYSILLQDESAFFHFQLQFRNVLGCSFSDWSYDALKTVLSSFANYPLTKPLYLILDAMDESEREDRYEIIQLLHRLCSATHSRIKIFLTSRPVVELNYHSDASHHVIKLQDENKHDIMMFVYDFLPNLNLPGPLLSEAADYINTNAEGVFLWVYVVKAELLRRRATGHNDKQIMHCLKCLPIEMVQFYELMLNRLEMDATQSDILDGLMIFRFVLFAIRPLTVAELQHILAVSSDLDILFELPLPEIDKYQINEFETRIMHCGGGFLEIKVDRTVELMHQSAREFFLRIEQEKRDSTFALSSKEAHRAITTTSIRYLTHCFANPTFPMIKSWSSEDYRSYVRYLDEWPGIKYTLHNLKFHRDLCGQNEAVSQHVTTLVRKLAGNQASYLLGNWIAFHFGQINSTLTGLLLPLTRTMRLEKSIRVHKYQATAENFKYNTLNAAAELMLHSVLETLLLLCTRYNDHADNKTPLIISAQKGLAAATQYLLDIDSDVNAIDDSVQTALHYAVKNRDQVIVRMLLEWEANKRTMDNSGRLGHPIAVPNVSFVLDLETQRRLYNTWSFGRRGWTYFQLSMERIVPIPIAWWPFDPPRLDLKYVVTVPQDPRKNTSSTVSGSPDGSVTAIPGSTPPCEHSAPQSSVLLLDGSRPTTHCHHSDVISTLVHSSEKTNGSSAGANDDTSPIVKSVSTSPKYILICFDVTKLRLHSGFQHNCRLRQVEVMNQMCDHEVFPLFRKEYYAICGALRRYLSLRALSHINFVKFQVYENDHANIDSKASDSLPPIDNTQYSFTSTNWARPLGSEQLVGYFHSRGGMECRTSRNVDLIPGRVEKLPLNENRREEPEWGLHFVEGLNFFGILVVVGISVSVSIACCIAVTVVYKDSGKGAGWGAFAAAVVAIFVACAALVSKV